MRCSGRVSVHGHFVSYPMSAPPDLKWSPLTPDILQLYLDSSHIYLGKHAPELGKKYEKISVQFKFTVTLCGYSSFFRKNFDLHQ